MTDHLTTGPIHEGRFIDIAGTRQWLTLSGRDRTLPVLLMLPGAGAGICRMAEFFAPWEAAFTLAQWDQPYAGVTLAAQGDAGIQGLTLARLASDGIAVAGFIHRRLPTARIVLLGISAGTTVGLMMARSRPDLFAGYVGTGQIVSWARQDSLSYELLLAQARKAGDAGAITALEKLGPPPYADTATDAVKSQYAGALTPSEQHAMASVDPAVLAAMQSPPPGAYYVPPGIRLADPRTAATAAYEALRNEITTFDARSLGLDYDLPLHFIQGAQDVFTVTSEVQAFEATLRAPRKSLTLIPDGSHSCYLQRDAFLAALRALPL